MVLPDLVEIKAGERTIVPETHELIPLPPEEVPPEEVPPEVPPEEVPPEIPPEEVPPEEVPPPEVPPEEVPPPPREVPPPVEEVLVNINSAPENARIYIDGTYIHHWTPCDPEEYADVKHLFTPGPHVITIRKGGLEASKEVDWVRGRNPDVFLVLTTPPPEEAPPEAPPDKGFLVITSRPKYARVWVDGVYTHHVTDCPQGELDPLTPGTHTVELRRKGYYYREDVEIKPGETYKIDVDIPEVGVTPPPPREGEPVGATRIGELFEQGILNIISVLFLGMGKTVTGADGKKYYYSEE